MKTVLIQDSLELLSSCKIVADLLDRNDPCIDSPVSHYQSLANRNGILRMCLLAALPTAFFIAEAVIRIPQPFLMKKQTLRTC